MTANTHPADALADAALEWHPPQPRHPVVLQFEIRVVRNGFTIKQIQIRDGRRDTDVLIAATAAAARTLIGIALEEGWPAAVQAAALGLTTTPAAEA